jgi:hypothetical protein
MAVQCGFFVSVATTGDAVFCFFVFQCAENRSAVPYAQSTGITGN